MSELKKTINGLAAYKEIEAFASIQMQLSAGLAALEDSTEWLLKALGENTDDALAGATQYLRQFGLVSGGVYMAQIAAKAQSRLADGDTDRKFLNARITSAQFFAEQYVSQAPGLTIAVTRGSDVLYAVDADALTGA